MTEHDPADTAAVFEAYRTYPAANGDLLLLLTELRQVLHLEGCADAWDPRIRRNLGAVFEDLGIREIQVAISRPDAELLGQDYALTVELREELAKHGISVSAPRGLPAAA